MSQILMTCKEFVRDQRWLYSCVAVLGMLSLTKFVFDSLDLGQSPPDYNCDALASVIQWIEVLSMIADSYLLTIGTIFVALSFLIFLVVGLIYRASDKRPFAKWFTMKTYEEPKNTGDAPLVVYLGYFNRFAYTFILVYLLVNSMDYLLNCDNLPVYQFIICDTNAEWGARLFDALSLIICISAYYRCIKAVFVEYPRGEYRNSISQSRT